MLQWSYAKSLQTLLSMLAGLRSTRLDMITGLGSACHRKENL